MESVSRRKRYYVDGAVQKALVLKVTHYCLLTLFTVGGLTFLGWTFVYPGLGSLIGPEAVISHVVPVFVVGLASALLVLPVAVRDLIRFSNRFVGPLVRVRQAMKQLADGEAVEPIQLRKDDFWHDLAESVNRLAEDSRTLSLYQDEILATNASLSSSDSDGSAETSAAKVSI